MPEEIGAALPKLVELLELMHIPTFQVPVHCMLFLTGRRCHAHTSNTSNTLHVRPLLSSEQLHPHHDM